MQGAFGQFGLDLPDIQQGLWSLRHKDKVGVWEVSLALALGSPQARDLVGRQVSLGMTMVII